MLSHKQGFSKRKSFIKGRKKKKKMGKIQPKAVQKPQEKTVPRCTARLCSAHLHRNHPSSSVSSGCIGSRSTDI